MTSPSVLYEVQDCVAVVTLNEGDRMNPLTESLQAGLRECIERVKADTSVRAMVLTARGRGFCVGADLEEFGRRSDGAGSGESLGAYVGRLMEGSGNPLILALRSLPVPLVCAINGAVAGGGVGFALAGDLVIAARSAYFYLPFVPALGLVPDMGATWALPRLVGRARALGLALTGDKLPAARAAEWGLIWACVDDAQLQAEAMRLAGQLAALPAHAIAEARAIFAASETNTLERQLALERERQQQLIDRDAFAEGVTAFCERRKPQFRGRAQAKP
jgi:2-(1,2-epoxy-1,2-dihydrophenyl)acetyl-CoA isomerase